VAAIRLDGDFAKRRQIVGIAAGHQLAVDHHLLVDDVAPAFFRSSRIVL
jgi:hypothetical protein